VGLFVERLTEYRANAVVVGPTEVAAAISAILRREGSRKVIVPAGFPTSWAPDAGMATLTEDGPALAAPDLDRFEAALSGCAVAVADTGTIVLDGGEAQGRRALSLVPDHLVIVVRADQVVPGVPDAVGRVAGAAVQTWISGPSATSDIELSRVEGGHGPRRLDVVITR
jgi:L-lactate dehydrogenase complex protein LldG